MGGHQVLHDPRADVARGAGDGDGAGGRAEGGGGDHDSSGAAVARELGVS